jgi:iron complex transport system substrate-binding protein
MDRKRLVLVFFMAIIMLVVSACGKSTDTGNKADSKVETEVTSTEESKTDNQAEAASTRVYQHMAGSSEIPAKAERVVTDWYYGQLVALGIKPVGTDDYVLKNHPFIEQAGTESIGQSMEKIIDLQPDLIISWGASKFEEFSKIAPTVPLELSGGPKDSVRIFGEILGREAEADQWIKQFDNKVEEARVKVSNAIDANETFTILNVWKDTLRVYGFVNMGGYALYEALQVTPAPKVDEVFRNSEEWYREISFEVISEFAGDHIILTTYDPAGTSTVLKDLEASAVWKNLDAVKNGRVHTIDYNSLYNDDPIAIENQIDILAEAILAGR